jgi:hypothetical protein
MSKTASKLLDFGSQVVIVLTLVLFLVALVLKGFTHELLLEAGVFLVSVKLILLSCKNNLSARLADERLAQMQDALRRIEGQASPPQ